MGKIFGTFFYTRHLANMATAVGLNKEKVLIATRNFPVDGEGAYFRFQCYIEYIESCHMPRTRLERDESQEVRFFKGSDGEKALRWVWVGKSDDDIEEEMKVPLHVHDCAKECKSKLNVWIVFRPLDTNMKAHVFYIKDFEAYGRTMDFSYEHSYQVSTFDNKEAALEWTFQ